MTFKLHLKINLTYFTNIAFYRIPWQKKINAKIVYSDILRSFWLIKFEAYVFHVGLNGSRGTDN